MQEVGSFNWSMKGILMVMERQWDDSFTINKVVPIQGCIHPSIQLTRVFTLETHEENPSQSGD